MSVSSGPHMCPFIGKVSNVPEIQGGQLLGSTDRDERAENPGQ